MKRRTERHAGIDVYANAHLKALDVIEALLADPEIRDWLLKEIEKRNAE